uniref:Protein phosphatase 1 regulatory subunit 14 n=1 Tax=Theropithecus gelada TaxID=9565 RepID=A0A8D2F4T5_THEGE
MADSGTAGGAALAAPAPGPGSGGPGPRVYFQSPPGAAGEGPGGADDEGPVRRQGKVTVKYDRKELRKRLNLEEWILEQLTRLYDCQEEEIPELEIDVDELLDMESDDARAARVKVRGLRGSGLPEALPWESEAVEPGPQASAPASAEWGQCLAVRWLWHLLCLRVAPVPWKSVKVSSRPPLQRTHLSFLPYPLLGAAG